MVFYKILALFSGVAFALLVFGMGCGTVGEFHEVDEASIQNGRELFIQKECVSCHDIRGEFPTVPTQLVVTRIDLSNRLQMTAREKWKSAIRRPAHGRSYRDSLPLEELTAMMIRSRRLSPIELNELVDFLTYSGDFPRADGLE